MLINQIVDFFTDYSFISGFIACAIVVVVWLIWASDKNRRIIKKAVEAIIRASHSTYESTDIEKAFSAVLDRLDGHFYFGTINDRSWKHLIYCYHKAYKNLARSYAKKIETEDLSLQPIELFKQIPIYLEKGSDMEFLETEYPFAVLERHIFAAYFKAIQQGKFFTSSHQMIHDAIRFNKLLAELAAFEPAKELINTYKSDCIKSMTEAYEQFMKSLKILSESTKLPIQKR